MLTSGFQLFHRRSFVLDAASQRISLRMRRCYRHVFMRGIDASHFRAEAGKRLDFLHGGSRGEYVMGGSCLDALLLPVSSNNQHCVPCSTNGGGWYREFAVIPTEKRGTMLKNVGYSTVRSFRNTFPSIFKYFRDDGCS